MANANSTVTSSLLDASDLLTQTEKVVSFIQSITLINPSPEDSLTLNSNQVTGLYYVLRNVRDNIEQAVKKIDAARLEASSHE